MEEDWSQIVADPRPGRPNKTRKLHRHERDARKKDPEHQRLMAERGPLYKEIRQAVLEDARHYMDFGQPLGSHHFFVWGVHKMASEMRATQEIVAKLFCLLYTSPSPRDATLSRMPSSA